MSGPKFKIGETVVVTEVNDPANSIYIGKLGIIAEYFLRFTEIGCDYEVRVLDSKRSIRLYANVREATEMDKVLEGL